MLKNNSIFVLKVLPFVIFISSLITILFYFGIMEWMICKLAWIMQSTMGTTAGESVNAAGNIFIGQVSSITMLWYYYFLVLYESLNWQTNTKSFTMIQLYSDSLNHRFWFGQSSTAWRNQKSMPLWPADLPQLQGELWQLTSFSGYLTHRKINISSLKVF